MKFPLYNLWMDNMFYVYLGAFAASLFMLAYSVRRLLRPAGESAAAAPLESSAAEEPEEPVEIIEELPAPAPAPEAGADKTMVVANVEELIAASTAAEAPADAGEKTLVVPNIEELISQAEDAAAEAGLPGGRMPEIRPAEALPQDQAPIPQPDAAPARPEEMVRGIYSRISGMDARVKAIEEHLKTGGGRHFAAKFLEGILEDFDALSSPKIKARIEYLLSDLKEARDRGAKDQGL